MSSELTPKNAAPAEPPVLNVCPHCQRKLLSVRSILCNWCGARIDDPAYLERAAHERAMEDARLRDQLEREAEETARHGILGRLKKNKPAAQPGQHLLIPPPDKL